MDLTLTTAYEEYGLHESARQGLADLGDLMLNSPINVTAVRDPQEIERIHFLDSLSLLRIEGLAAAHRVADIGSGGGLPALVLALALPGAEVTAIESIAKKCAFIETSARALGLKNVVVRCARVEEYGRKAGRTSHEVVVSRAVASLPVLAEYSIPLLRIGGRMVAMKGTVSDQERIQAERALAILGGGRLVAVDLVPFEGSRSRWAFMANKVSATPDVYPRRSGVPGKRPLGGTVGPSESERQGGSLL